MSVSAPNTPTPTLAVTGIAVAGEHRRFAAVAAVNIREIVEVVMFICEQPRPDHPRDRPDGPSAITWRQSGAACSIRPRIPPLPRA